MLSPAWGSTTHEILDGADALRAAGRLEVLIENLDRRRAARLGRRHEDVELVGRRRAVEDVEARGHLRPVAAAVARKAGHHLAAAEVLLVDALHHDHHLAGHLLARAGVLRVIRPVVGGGGMAVFAREAEGGGEHAHGAHEFVNRNAAQDGHVLEDLFSRHLALRRGGRSRLRRLSAHERHAQQPRCRRANGAARNPTRSEPHDASAGM
jgi:hypothetical protein